MSRILLSASFPPDLMLRQTPGHSGSWKGCQFVSEDELDAATSEEEFDAWVVYDDLRNPREVACSPLNTLLITGEPESLRRYRKRFTSQFGRIWTSHASIHHPHVKRRNEGQHWHYALNGSSVHGCQLGFDELAKMSCPQKTKLLSVICSSKAHTEDHRKRLEFVHTLQVNFGEQVDVFGRGIRDLDDKAEAIYDYRYHIVLENDHSDFFMTEKLGDAFLGWSYPIYFGGSEAYYRFPEGSFTAIDIYKPAEAISIIRSVIESETYERCMPRVSEARNRVLYTNNICNMMAEYWSEYISDSPAVPTRLLPKKHRAGLVLDQLKRKLSQPFASTPVKRKPSRGKRAA